jgi:putative ABC transport system substrate-binding protein
MVAVDHRRKIAEFATAKRLPTIAGLRMFVDSGGLMSYGADVGDVFRRSVGYVDKILKGAKPSELPIEQPTRFELVINLKTASALGLTIPPLLTGPLEPAVRIPIVQSFSDCCPFAPSGRAVAALSNTMNSRRLIR